jgi:hypothetical protein
MSGAPTTFTVIGPVVLKPSLAVLSNVPPGAVLTLPEAPVGHHGMPVELLHRLLHAALETRLGHD